MSTSDRNSLPPQQTARERVAARRAARQKNRPSIRERLSKLPKWRIPLGILGILGVLILFLIIAAYRFADQTLDPVQQVDPRFQSSAAAQERAEGIPVATPAPPLESLEEPVNILLIGVDKRANPDEGIRGDTLILVRLHPEEKWASMLSIPRDSVVSIRNLGEAKINTAYSYGYTNAAAIYGEGTEPDAAGGAFVAETVEQFLGVRVDYTAQVDFQGFVQLVDALGGITIDVPKPLLDAEFPTDEGYGVERIYIPAGLQVMDGRTALVYARSRHSSNDFERSKRQQQVLRAAFAQVRTRGMLENMTVLPEWGDVIAQNIRTTLPIRDLGVINGLATFAAGLDTDRIIQTSINPDEVAMRGEYGSDIYWDPADIRALVSDWQQGPQAAPRALQVQVLNGAAIEGVAGRVTEMLRSEGFAMADANNAPQIYEQTTVIDYTNQPDARREIGEILGIDRSNVQMAANMNAPPQTDGVDIVVIIGMDYQE